MSIEFVDVHKAFGNKEVLKGFTLTIPEGETVSVIGGSGSGKSVALKHIVGLLRPDEGDVWVDGENIARLDQESVYQMRRKIGYVFQFAALFDSMTVGENVGMGLRRIPGMQPAASNYSATRSRPQPRLLLGCVASRSRASRRSPRSSAGTKRPSDASARRSRSATPTAT